MLEFHLCSTMPCRASRQASRHYICNFWEWKTVPLDKSFAPATGTCSPFLSPAIPSPAARDLSVLSALVSLLTQLMMRCPNADDDDAGAGCCDGGRGDTPRKDLRSLSVRTPRWWDPQGRPTHPTVYNQTARRNHEQQKQHNQLVQEIRVHMAGAL